jgi:hypothetical protein
MVGWYSKIIYSKYLAYRYKLYKQGPEPADVRQPAGFGEAVIVLHLSPHREAGPLTSQAVFREK